MTLPETAYRVPMNTAEEINRQIEAEMHQRLQYYAVYPQGIDRRLRELDEEWDIERTLEANAAAFGLAGLALGLGVDRRFLALPVAVLGFLMQHAVQGWCPPVPVFRRRGVRTQREIDTERLALKILRGDLDPLGRHENPTAIARAVER